MYNNNRTDFLCERCVCALTDEERKKQFFKRFVHNIIIYYMKVRRHIYEYV